MSDLSFEVIGSDMQLIEVALKPGQVMQSEPGMMVYFEEGIRMNTSTGGFFKGLKRIVSGEKFFMTYYEQKGPNMSKVAFAAPYPGKVIPVTLDGSSRSNLMCQRESFLCAQDSISISVGFVKRFGAGMFGKHGFLLQKLTGEGIVFIHAGGTVVEKQLVPGEVLRLDASSLVAFSAEVDYDIELVGGIKNTLFGQEGLFLAKLTGPGKVYVQSLPFVKMADRIMAAVDITEKN